ncbi:MAG: NAD+ synthase [Promethearchaeota archaeon]
MGNSGGGAGNYAILKVGLVQMNSRLGDLPYNRDKIIEYIRKAEDAGCDIVVFPELVTTGYPVQDLIFREGFVEDNLKIVEQIRGQVRKTVAVVGCITKADKREHPLAPFYNSAAIIIPKTEGSGGSLPDMYFTHKHLLPNYDVFDEKRYFTGSREFKVLNMSGMRIGVEICEDVWDDSYQVKVTNELKKLGADFIININSSPYYIEKPYIREEVVRKHARSEGIPFVYLNMVGGQDEITFDGRSIVVDHLGRVIKRLPSFEEVFEVVEVPVPISPDGGLSKAKDDKRDATKDGGGVGGDNGKIASVNGPNGVLSEINGVRLDPPQITISTEEFIKKYKEYPLEIDVNEEIYKALTLNLRDYYYKIGIFKGIVLGLSGGIDSSLTAAIACGAVGPENVVGILMPSRFSSDHSVNDAVELAKNLGMKYYIAPIKKIHDVFESEMHEAFKVDTFTLAEENLQARIRGTLLMYYSNKFNALLVSTGNKSEIAVGYCTLYGDTNGGKNVPGDLFKWRVYELSKWINRKALKEKGHVLIPENSIKKPPSAELRENQTDQDFLPEYDVLDKILTEFIENEKSVEEIANMGFDLELVKSVERMYFNAEFKRRQMCQTIMVTKKGFGIGRRYPIINKYHLIRDKI